MTPLSQRDVRWNKVPLGTSTTTIGSHGCTITCVAMLAGKTPTEVNALLKSVGGYANGNLIIWEKIDALNIGLTFKQRVRSWNEESVLISIEKYGGCLVEVDGAPIGGDKHWVLQISRTEIIDPWTGTIRPTSTYKPVGYSIIAREVDPAPTTPSVEKTLLDWLGVKSVEEAQKVIETHMGRSGNGGYLADARKRVSELEALLSAVESAYKTQKEEYFTSLGEVEKQWAGKVVEAQELERQACELRISQIPDKAVPTVPKVDSETVEKPRTDQGNRPWSLVSTLVRTLLKILQRNL
jgi:hypothetical protein